MNQKTRDNRFMEEIYTIRTLAQVKAISDPLRLRMLEAFCNEPMTTKQVASMLGEKATKLYHHAVLLERAGLIQLVKTKPNRGTIEKYYQAVARLFTVDQSLLSVSVEDNEAGEQGFQAMIATALNAGITDLQDRFAGGQPDNPDNHLPLAVAHTRIRLTKAELTELTARLEAWIADARAKDHANAELDYSLTLAFFPIRKLK
jgi:DNA-binding transcriptional ArsR family regulator